MWSGCTHTLEAGTTTKSANAPSRLTPTELVRMHICRRPERQLRHRPQTMCPSTETRWPTRSSSRPSPAVTPGPISTISP